MRVESSGPIQPSAISHRSVILSEEVAAATDESKDPYSSSGVVLFSSLSFAWKFWRKAKS
jgi:hypothetical protein